MTLLVLAAVLGSLERAGADDAIPMSRSGIENIYICNGVAHRLHAADAPAQDTVINGMEAIPEVKAISAEVRSLATQRVERMRSEAELRDFDKRFCDRAVIGRMI
jgi:hypothetical protein